ncbi:MAG: SDR family oxidoreductase [Saprospiraceae bacterium]
MILIVGGTGFLGSEIARQLLAQGNAVRVMTRSLSKAASLEKLGAEVLYGDLIRPDTLQQACSGSETVIAAAHALLGRGKYASSKVDDAGHRRLIDAAKAADVQHFIYTSVLGAASGHLSAFWRTKYGVEQYLQKSGLPYTILRPAAFMEVHAHELLGKSILLKGKATIFGKGENPTNFVAVRDVAQFAVQAVNDSAMRNQIIEIGGPENLTRKQVVALYERFSGQPAKISHVPRGALRFMSALFRPLHPGLSEIMGMSELFDRTDQTFDPGPMLEKFPMQLTPMERFIEEKTQERQDA